MQTTSRIAGVLTEIGSATQEAAVIDESFVFHNRTLALDEAALRRDPQKVSCQRDLAGELCFTAYAHVLAKREAATAQALVDSAVTMDRELAAADPNNAEAHQDLANALYISGRVRQMRNDGAGAVAHYQEAVHILETLVKRDPANSEAAFDLRRARQGIVEIESASPLPIPVP